MKCLYRDTPDVARHAALAQKNNDVINLFDNHDDVMGPHHHELQGPIRPADDASTDSNTDSGRGTSDAGNDSTNRIQFNIPMTNSDQSRARMATQPEIHEYLSMQPNIVTSAQRQNGGASTFGAHLQPLRVDRHAAPPVAMSSPGAATVTSQRKNHVTFQLPHKSIDRRDVSSARNSSQKFTLAPPQTAPPPPQSTSAHFRPIYRATAAPPSPSAYVDMTQGSRGLQQRGPSVLSEVDNVSIASSSSGEYFVQFDPTDSRLKSVEV